MAEQREDDTVLRAIAQLEQHGKVITGQFRRCTSKLQTREGLLYPTNFAAKLLEPATFNTTWDRPQLSTQLGNTFSGPGYREKSGTSVGAASPAKRPSTTTRGVNQYVHWSWGRNRERQVKQSRWT